ncbi:hypothetical protein [Paraflavitalea speifideaquila]|uniref:hypothetical protein n=1 Tax=Paraflavitalea speifideaquila TaxID=3076558 RepID=UPI0028EE0387|nr:hypothetical protein [Paraflavitalea speifideiaquila]
MKGISAALILLFSACYASGQTTAQGYYVTQANDTIAAQIKIKKGILGQQNNDLNEKVEVMDSIKGIIKYLPEDINAYGFLYKGHKYVFVSKPIKNGSRRFLAAFYIGTKSSLYYYGFHNTEGTFGSKQVFYTFERPGNTYLFLKNTVNKQFKSQVKEFYKDSPAVMEIIDSKLRYWLDLDKDLVEILQKANLE